ncbi:hypothetical protein KAI92_03460 [Candidatus Parcubacteria bacterium]|nr:hypothetical protein [Candidatus Parcubacteria bacterium]
MDLSKAKIDSLTIKITVEVGGEKFDGEIDQNELFCVTLMKGIRNNKNPVDVIALLANKGANYLSANNLL